MTPEEVYERVKKQVPFIRGITVSGGECMLWPEFLKELFALCKKDGLGTMIDSNGTIDFREYQELLSLTDGVMLDIKAFDRAEHIHVTGADNAAVLANAAYLAEQGRLFEVRCVIVPDLYDTEQSIRAMAEYLVPLYQKQKFRIKVIAYRPMGVREEYAHFQVPTREYLEYLSNILKEQGFQDIIII
jgi:pyruvate formate lyase activating enzyme